MSGVDFTGLLAWQRAMDLAVAVYKLSASLPLDERYGLRAQMRRAAVSIPANIAEGQGRRTRGEFLNHLSVAHGSVRELETCFLLTERLNLIDAAQSRGILNQAADVGRLITGLAKALQR